MKVSLELHGWLGLVLGDCGDVCCDDVSARLRE